jgi:hypothetical protein
MKELHLPKLKSIVQIWISMMTHQQEANNFAQLLGDYKYNVNPFVEVVKKLIGLQKSHTAPALFLAFSERLPKVKPEYYIQLGEKIKNELKIILGFNFKNCYLK